MSKTVGHWAEDERLVEDASNDDRVDEFMRQHQGELLRFFQGRLAQPQDAADLAQESCIRLLRYRQTQSESSLRFLLFRIARNLLNDYWRWNRLHSAEEPTDLNELILESEDPCQERLVEGQRRLERLEEAVLGLPAKCRAVFLLSRVEGLTNHQVAVRCGISVKTVEKHITRAMAECRRQVGDLEP